MLQSIDENYRGEATVAGANAFIVKEVVPEQLVVMLHGLHQPATETPTCMEQRKDRL